MKYMLLTYSSPGTWERLSWREQDQRTKEHAALVEELFDSGEYVDGNTLTAAARARTLRSRDGTATAADGPYLDAVEHLVGYDVVDCESPGRAEAIAARLSEATQCGVEIRPIMHMKSMEM